MVNLAYDVVEMLPLMILQFSWCGYSVELGSMPDFEPNEWLYTNHADKGNENWEIFAWAVRDIMAKTGNF